MDHETKEEEINPGEDLRMSNFSLVIAVVFVTIVMVFLFVKILFD